MGGGENARCRQALTPVGPAVLPEGLSTYFIFFKFGTERDKWNNS